MRRFESTIRLALAAAPGLLAALVLAAVAVMGVASRTSIFATALDETTVYGLAVPVLAAELADSDLVMRINTGPLALSRDDVHDILVARFDADDVALKAREVHAGLVEYVRSFPEDLVFEISIRRERPVLARAAERRVVERFLALPDCGPGTDLGILGRAGARELLDDSSDREFLASLPDCRPPDAVAEEVVAGIRAEFRTLLLEGPDSVEAFPDPATVERATYSARLRRVQVAERFLGRRGWIPAAAVLLGLVAVGVGSRRSTLLPGGWLLVAGVGAGLLVSAGMLSLDGAPRALLELFGAEPDGDAVRRMWLGLGEHGVRRVLRYVAELFLPVGAILLAGGAAGRLARGRARSGRASRLRTRTE